MIRIHETDGLHEIIDDVIEENGWIIIEQKDGTWALYENSEWQILEPHKPPFKVYSNHELGDAILQAQKWT